MDGSQLNGFLERRGNYLHTSSVVWTLHTLQWFGYLPLPRLEPGVGAIWYGFRGTDEICVEATTDGAYLHPFGAHAQQTLAAITIAEPPAPHDAPAWGLEHVSRNTFRTDRLECLADALFNCGWDLADAPFDPREAARFQHPTGGSFVTCWLDDATDTVTVLAVGIPAMLQLTNLLAPAARPSALAALARRLDDPREAILVYPRRPVVRKAAA